MTYVSDQGVTGDKKDIRYGLQALHSPSEEDKEKKEYLYFWANFFIGRTHQDAKIPILKAYAQKRGTMDPYRLLRLNRKYGIANPSEVPHIPVIEPYWRRLKGTHKSTPIRFQTTTNNTSSYVLKQKEKTEEILNNLAVLEEQIFVMANKGINSSAAEKVVDEMHLRLKNKVENEWRSSLEVQSQHAMNYLVERCNVKDVLDDCFDDYGVTKLCAWQCKVEKIGELPVLRSLDPRNVFFSKSSNTKWLRDCDSYVYKERMLVTDVITKYGEYFNKEQMDIISNEKAIYWNYYNHLYHHSQVTSQMTDDKDFQMNGMKGEYIDVYYVEWKANNKKESENDSEESRPESMVDGPDKIYSDGYRQDLYSCVRVGSCIYLKSGKHKHILRHQDTPDKCDLTIDGIVYESRFGDVDSLWQRCAHLNDDYDVYKWHMSLHIARAGSKVSPVVLQNIPSSYGNDETSRIIEHYKREKDGIYVIDTSQPGYNFQAQQLANVMRDTSISKDINVLIEILNYIEELISRLIGVPRQALGDIGQTDGKGTTQMALMQYLMVSQDIFMDMHKVTQVMLTMLINYFRIAFPKGFEASYTGNEGKQHFFKTDKQFSLASYNVFLSNTGEEQALLELFRQIASDMAAQGNLDKEDLIVIMSAKSLVEVQRELYSKLEAKKDTMVSELQQQLAQMEEQLKEMKRQVDVNQQAENEVNAEKLKLQQEKQMAEAQLKEKQLSDEKEFKDGKLQLDQRRVDLEADQLLIGNSSNAEIRNN